MNRASTADAPVVELREVHKSFGALKVLDGLGLTVRRGEVFGFLGRNGAGKSTAIRVLMGITRPDSGRVLLFGEAVASDTVALRRRVGYVAQEQTMYPWMTPRQLGRFVSGFYPRWDETRWRDLCRSFALPARRRVGTFSGGMKAKLALALALATRPELLLLDEPTAGMDPVARREFLDLVREQTTRDGATTLFSTHLVDEIEAVADRIGIVEAGRTLYEGRLEPLVESVARFSIEDRSDGAEAFPTERFAAARPRLLDDRLRHGRRELTLRFDGPVAEGFVSVDGWRRDAMTLEDVFIAVVAANGGASARTGIRT